LLHFIQLVVSPLPLPAAGARDATSPPPCLLASSGRLRFFKMPRATSDAKLLIQSLTKAYAATPTNLKIIDLYVICAVATALIQVAYMGLVGSFPFNSFLSGVLSCIGTAVLAGRNFVSLVSYLWLSFYLHCTVDDFNLLNFFSLPPYSSEQRQQGI
ncbi:unnamed protein product, partial [Urochloa humidicola]